MRSAEARLRKYRRKKLMAFRSRSPELPRYLALYWRYHHSVYGDPVHLWGTPVPAPQKKPKGSK